jgi:hypothetical protein
MNSKAKGKLFNIMPLIHVTSGSRSQDIVPLQGTLNLKRSQLQTAAESRCFWLFCGTKAQTTMLQHKNPEGRNIALQTLHSFRRAAQTL